MPASDPDISTVPEGLPADLASAWSTAIASLTDRELSALVLRFGFTTGKPESFSAIGRELGANRIRAQAIFRNAIQRLGAQDETCGLARYLADLNAVLSEEEPVERASRPVPVIEDIGEVVSEDGEEPQGSSQVGMVIRKNQSPSGFSSRMATSPWRAPWPYSSAKHLSL